MQTTKYKSKLSHTVDIVAVTQAMAAHLNPARTPSANQRIKQHLKEKQKQPMIADPVTLRA